MSKICKTCEEIEFWKQNKSDNVNSKVFANISQYRWPKGKRKIKGKQCSTITSEAYDLNYCPTCGKKLR